MEIKQVETKSGKIRYMVGDMAFATLELAQEYLDSKISESKNASRKHQYLEGEAEFLYESDDEATPSFKRFISELVLEKELNISSLARELGVSRQTLYNWMDGKAIPENKQVQEICRIFDVEAKDVWRGLIDNFKNQFRDFFDVCIPNSEEIRLFEELLESRANSYRSKPGYEKLRYKMLALAGKTQRIKAKA